MPSAVVTHQSPLHIFPRWCLLSSLSLSPVKTGHSSRPSSFCGALKGKWLVSPLLRSRLCPSVSLSPILRLVLYILRIPQVKLFPGKSVMLNLDFQAKSYLFDEEFAIMVEDWKKGHFSHHSGTSPRSLKREKCRDLFWVMESWSQYH